MAETEGRLGQDVLQLEIAGKPSAGCYFGSLSRAMQDYVVAFLQPFCTHTPGSVI